MLLGMKKYEKMYYTLGCGVKMFQTKVIDI